MSKGTVILLCNLTMNFAEPWLDGGYRVVMVDPQHEKTSDDGRLFRIKATVLDALPLLRHIMHAETVVFGAAFPPCTDMAVSGARWFEHKRKADPMFQAKAVSVAEQCRTVLTLAGAPGFLENPVSVLSRVFGKAQHSFHPHQYTGHCPDDNYTKNTQLWTFGDFVMPPEAKLYSLGAPDDRIHKAPPSEERGNIRSATPRGFSIACYIANAPHLRAQRMAA
jgi:hypothetical protein